MIEAIKLTVKEHMNDWFVIERAEHDGREWFERTGPNSSALRLSSRFSDADVEGTAVEMLAIAEAIENENEVCFKRCQTAPIRAHLTAELLGFAFNSPRNSSVDGQTTVECAKALAVEIRRVCVVPLPSDAEMG